MSINNSIASIQNKIKSNNAYKTQYNKKNKAFEQKNIGNFDQVLANQQAILNKNNLKFSKHASQRLSSRDIVFSEEQIDKINSGVEKAREKGIKDSLVLIQNVALIVNVPSKTVVTAMEQGQQNDSIFTNIDGAILL